ncbi:MAG: DUF3592 domain-containing protein [Sulfurimonas sp.]|nr:DUF3592 domain-containing protein [Sulfurimonas sp.]
MKLLISKYNFILLIVLLIPFYFIIKTLFLISTSVQTEGTIIDCKSSLTYSRGGGGYTYSIEYERPGSEKRTFTAYTYTFLGFEKGTKIPIVYSKYTSLAQIDDLYIVWRPTIIYSLFAIVFAFFVWLGRKNLSSSNTKITNQRSQ